MVNKEHLISLQIHGSAGVALFHSVLVLGPAGRAGHTLVAMAGIQQASPTQKHFASLCLLPHCWHPTGQSESDSRVMSNQSHSGRALQSGQRYGHLTGHVLGRVVKSWNHNPLYRRCFWRLSGAPGPLLALRCPFCPSSHSPKNRCREGRSTSRTHMPSAVFCALQARVSLCTPPSPAPRAMPPSPARCSLVSLLLQ